MKKCLMTMFFLTVFIQFLSAQVIQVLNVNLPVPQKLSSWQSNDNIISVLLINNTTTDFLNAKISIKITDENGKVVVKTNDNDPKMPKFTIRSKATLNISGKNLMNLNAMTIDSKFKSIVTQTNSLPESNYQFCVRLLSEQGNEIGSPAEACRNIEIRIPQPPQLITPVDKQTLYNSFPQFLWTPVTTAADDQGVIIQYKLTVVKLLDNQSPKDGIDRNVKLINKICGGSLYQLLPSDISLDNYYDKNAFAWQIQAIDAATQKPYGGLDGKSEIWTFFANQKIPGNVILSSPANNSIVDPSKNDNLIFFKWTDVHPTMPTSRYKFALCEILDGQNFNDAVEKNVPIVTNDKIPAGKMEFSVNATQNKLKDQHKYAWRVWTYSNNAGIYTDSSQIWTFTAKMVQTKYDPILIIQPMDKADFSPEKPKDSNDFAFNFEWDQENVSKSAKEYNVLIMPMKDGDNPETVINNGNDLKVFTVKYNPTSTKEYLSRSDGAGDFENNQKYAWQIIASGGPNSDVIAKSPVQTFTVVDTNIVDKNIKQFRIGKHIVNIVSVSGYNKNSFKGKGKVKLWANDSPEIDVSFSALHIKKMPHQKGLTLVPWVVVMGKISESVSLDHIKMNYSEPEKFNDPVSKWGGPSQCEAWINIQSVTFNPDTAAVSGILFFKGPMACQKDGNYSSFLLEGDKNLFNLDPKTGVKGTTGLNNHNSGISSFYLLFPKREIELSDQTKLCVNDNTLTLLLNGSMMWDVYDENGILQYPVSVPLKNFPGLYGKVNFGSESAAGNDAIVLALGTRNQELQLVINTGYANLYDAYVFPVQCKIKMRGGLPPILFDQNKNFVINPYGVKGNLSYSFGSGGQKVKYRGYDMIVKELNINVLDGVLTSVNYLKGDMSVPFFNKSLEVIFNITTLGVSDGNINTSSLKGSYSIASDTKTGEVLIFNLNDQGIHFDQFRRVFNFGGSFQLVNLINKTLITDPCVTPTMEVDTLGNLYVKDGGSQDGYIYCEDVKGSYNNFNITINGFKYSQDKNSISSGVTGKIVFTDDLSSNGGSVFKAEMKFDKIQQGQGSNENRNYRIDEEWEKDHKGGGRHNSRTDENSIEPADISSLNVDPVTVGFDNGTTSFGASVKVFEKDPTYGSGFLAKTSMHLTSPSDITADCTLLIGTVNGFTYWFTEADAKVTPIPIGVIDLAVNEFKGRVYSHMSHSGTDINQADYVPDKNSSFGLYAKVHILTKGTNGSVLWGNTSLEMNLLPNGLKTKIIGDVYILSSGDNDQDACIKGNATIYISTNPMIFHTTVNVNANFYDALCANGTLDLLLSDGDYHLNLGTKANPVQTNMFCSFDGYNGYLNINQYETTVCAGYRFDTDVQHWGAGGFGIWGHAWGSIDIGATLHYNPNFQITAWGDLEGGVQIGATIFHHDFSLLDVEMGAHLYGTLPHPTCFAGSIYARACIKIIIKKYCLGTNFNIRYKDGSFALTNSCDN